MREGRSRDAAALRPAAPGARARAEQARRAGAGVGAGGRVAAGGGRRPARRQGWHTGRGGDERGGRARGSGSSNEAPRPRAPGPSSSSDSPERRAPPLARSGAWRSRGRGRRASASLCCFDPHSCFFRRPRSLLSTALRASVAERCAEMEAARGPLRGGIRRTGRDKARRSENASGGRRATGVLASAKRRGAPHPRGRVAPPHPLKAGRGRRRAASGLGSGAPHGRVRPDAVRCGTRGGERLRKGVERAVCGRVITGGARGVRPAKRTKRQIPDARSGAPDKRKRGGGGGGRRQGESGEDRVGGHW